MIPIKDKYCRLFNAKCSFYKYIRYIWFRLIRFYGILTTVGFLCHIVLIHIYQIYMTCKYIFDNIFKLACAHFYGFEYFYQIQSILFIINRYVSLTMQFNISHSFANSLNSKQFFLTRR